MAPPKQYQRLTLSIWLILLLSSWVTLHAEKTLEPLIVVSTDDNAPFSFTLPNGTKTGLYIEFWKLWSKTNDIPITIILTTFEESLALAKHQRTIHSGLFINDTRKQWADFSIPIHKVNTRILYYGDYAKSVKLKDQKGLRVSVYSSSFQADYLLNSLPSLKLTFFNDTTAGIKLLLKGETDAVVGELPALEAEVSRLGLTGIFTLADETLLSNTVHGTIAKGQTELLETINRGIENIPVMDLIALEEKWLPNHIAFFKDNQSFKALTIAEKKWLQLNSSFTLGIESDAEPFELIDDQGNYYGLITDYVKHIQNTLNIKFLPVTENTWLESFAAMQKGNVDIMAGIVNTPERRKTISFSLPYFQMTTVIVTLKNSFYTGTMSSLNNKKLGLIDGFLVELIGKNYPEIQIHIISSIADGLEKLNSGEIDAVIDAISALNLAISKGKYSNLIISGFTPYKAEISMAVRKGLEPLIPILNKVFENMSEKQKASIANNWLSVRVQTGTNITTLLTWGLPIFSVLILIILFVMHTNKRLKNEITMREESDKQRQAMESQLHQSQKMEALGKLTGGIAHDFNNILGVIQGYSELLKSSVTDSNKTSDYASNIYRAARRGEKLTKRLLSFSSQQPHESRPLNINTLLRQQQDMLQKTLTVGIELAFDLANDLWTVELDRGLLEDAILNISINAMHAMENNQSPAKLLFCTENLSLNEKMAQSLGLKQGDYVLLSLTDNGCGIEEASQKLIFDPFFTTKGNLGTGLGLSQVFGFVQHSDGVIRVISKPNHGSQFMLYFPRLLGEPVNSNTDSVINKEKIDIKGDETILVVDDEVSLTRITSIFLLAQGYQIFMAQSGKQALELLENEHVDLMISDVIMQEMDGYQLSVIVQEKYPEIKIQLVSGYTGEQSSRMKDNELHQKLLHKPYESQILLKRIRTLLDS